jgi:hypothetical protein
MSVSYFLEETYYNNQFLSDKIPAYEKCRGSLINDGILKKGKKEKDFKFSFVGIIVNPGTGSDLIIVLPKYLDSEFLDNQQQCHNYTNLLIRVFRKYAKNSSLDQLDEVAEKPENNLLAIVDYLINDYLEYGLYSNDQESFELNGNGTINWEKTIEEEMAIISNRRPIYFDMLTRIEENDENDYIRQIHQNIIYECFSLLEEFSFLEIFEYPSLYITKAKSLIEDELHQSALIDIELSKVFSDRKIMLLKAMQHYLNRKAPLSSSELLFFGTKSFNNIWEKVLKHCFQDEYDQYKICMDKPQWYFGFASTVSFSDPLIPDIIRRVETDLLILDAKYYRLPFDNIGQLTDGHPGINDINKQYLYELTMRQCACNDDISGYFNAFLFPSTALEVKYIGNVRMPLFDKMDSGPVFLFAIPAQDMYKMYLEERTIEPNELQRNYIDEMKKGCGIILP